MRGETNPVARSNVCPEIDPPAEPSFHAFCFTVAAQEAAPTFVVAGSGEARRRRSATIASTPCAAARPSPDAMREKARFVLGEMERRLALLGFPGRDTTATQVYTMHDLHPFWPTRSCGAVRRTPG